MKNLLIISFFALFTLIPSAASAQSIDYDALAAHPRLLLRTGEVTAMRDLPSASKGATLAHNRIVAESERLISEAMLERRIADGSMAELTDELMRRVIYLSYAYLTTDDVRYAQRAEREMLAVSGYEDWNPTNLADVGRIVMALSIGYDWLYRYLPVHSRSIIGTAIYEKGLLSVKDRTLEAKDAAAAIGLIYGALATMERSADYCKALIDRSLPTAKSLLDRYAADGGHLDGYAGWRDNTDAVVLLAMTLRSALGIDSGITDHAGFMRTASILNYLSAPSGEKFNFYGIAADAVMEPAKYWFAREQRDASMVRTDEVLAADGKLREDYMLPIYMICASTLDHSKNTRRHDNTLLSDGDMPLYVYRSDWADANDTYFAIKGGEAVAEKERADAGAFVYERDGVRWVTLDGGFPYNTPTMDGDYLSSSGLSTIRETTLSSRRRGVVSDLTPKYARRATRVERTALLDKNDNLTIIDHIECNRQSAMVEWSFATRSEVEITAPNTILLREGGKTLYVRIRSRLSGNPKVTTLGDAKRVSFTVDIRAGGTADIEVSFSSDSRKSVSLPKLPKLGNIFRKK